MEVEITESQMEQLNALAMQTGRGTDDLVQEALSKMLAFNDWFKAQVEIGVGQIQRGEFIEEAEMDARVENMIRS